MKIIVSIIICFIVAFATADSAASAPSIQLDVFSGSNPWWLAFAVRNAGVDTNSVQIKEAQSSSWKSMDYSRGWGYFTYSSDNRMNYPVSVILTSVTGAQITINNAITSVSVGTVNTGVSYGSASANPTTAPTTAAPATAAPTTKPAATAAPTTKTTASAAPTTKPAATAKPAATTRPAATTKPVATTRPAATTKPVATTKATTKPVATTAPTTKPVATTKATTKPAATTAPSTGTGCTAGLKLLVPLYQYPGKAWDTVAASGGVVSTVAIINPSSGPGNGPDSTFNTYMTKLHNAGVEMIGYVHTSYGARSISEVKAEIDIYASQFPLVVGIFLDEVAATQDQVAYYTQLYTYIMGMPGWKYDVINPGAVPVAGYLNAATQIVSFEDTSSKFAASSNPTYATCSNKDKFAVITYGATSSGMQTAVNTAKSKGYYGWVYVTDGASGCCTYNALASYYASMASYVAAN
jgi:outer membrane biosynthesis protein TonB